MINMISGGDVEMLDTDYTWRINVSIPILDWDSIFRWDVLLQRKVTGITKSILFTGVTQKCRSAM